MPRPAKPLAKLGAGLLARKGEARPAMRRPLPDAPAREAEPLEDLGWNDMGDALPPVLVQREALEAELAEALRLVREERGGRSAFTLRLDPDRHLRLRMACALDGRSAQALLTEALDRLLEARPQVDALIRQVRADETIEREE
jgi:hypothetical protein